MICGSRCSLLQGLQHTPNTAPCQLVTKSVESIESGGSADCGCNMCVVQAWMLFEKTFGSSVGKGVRIARIFRFEFAAF